MASNIIVTVNTSGMLKKLRKQKNIWNQAAADTAVELAHKGASFAKSKSPVFTGRTRGSIIYRKGVGRHMTEVRALDSRPEKPNFHLPWQMHNNPLVKNRIRTGSPTFMLDTELHLDKIADGVANKKLR